MKVSKEHIKGIKEALLLCSFLCILFSFSNKRFLENKQQSGKDLRTEYFSKHAAALPSENSTAASLNKEQLAQDLPGLLTAKQFYRDCNTRLASAALRFFNPQPL